MKERITKIKNYLKKHPDLFFNISFVLMFFCGLFYIAGTGTSSLDVFVWDIVCLFIYVIYLVFGRSKD